jgi:hypothetical protein
MFEISTGKKVLKIKRRTSRSTYFKSLALLTKCFASNNFKVQANTGGIIPTPGKHRGGINQQEGELDSQTEQEASSPRSCRPYTRHHYRLSKFPSFQSLYHSGLIRSCG